MTKTPKTNAANENHATDPLVAGQSLTGLFDEMQALMAVMPGAAFDTGAKVSTEEETEAMFDNMPV
ncbi:hypothetical protein [Pseudorhodobacter ferrugineus]|uniref:hypothetical protein n=1 Tax=Pseudorhodobacter ferrugineus TaxID=77008 RepID=UPI0003B3CD8E|nr:hypothetical protein [Pseudorhodobacter ferrugineus]